MEETQIAAEVVKQARHWFFDAQIFWAALVAGAGGAFSGWAIYNQTRSGEREIARKEANRIKAVAIQISAECSHNKNAIEAPLDKLRQNLTTEVETAVMFIRANVKTAAHDEHFTDLGNLGLNVCHSIAKAYESTALIQQHQAVAGNKKNRTQFINTANNVVRTLGIAIESLQKHVKDN